MNLKNTPAAPIAKKIEKTLQTHGHQRIDPYYWLNQRDDPDVLQYLNDENEFTQASLAHTEKLQSQLYKEIIGRIKPADTSVPYFDNGYFYYERFEADQEYPIYCRKRGSLESPEEILLDANKLASEYDYFDIGDLSVSPDNCYLAYSSDTVGRRQYKITIKELASSKILFESISETDGSCEWAADSNTVFYVLKHPHTLRSWRVMMHCVNTPASDGVEVFCELDDTFECGIEKTKSRQFILIASHSTVSSEYRFVSSQFPHQPFQIVESRERNHEYYIDHVQNDFYIVTNWKAKNFRVMRTPVEKTDRSHWREVIPHRDDVLLENIELFTKYLVIEERHNGLTKIRVQDWQTNHTRYLEFEEDAYSASLSVNCELHSNTLRFEYTSLTTPDSTFDLNLDSFEKKLLKQEDVLGGFSSADYISEKLFASASDGVRIPISLVYHKNLLTNLKQGNHPLLLYGYGSYGISIDAEFSSSRLSLLNRGFIFAIAHVRGGEELGREWYEDGKLFNKKNTFSDFISCAEYLLDQRYSKRENLFACGRSAGGLLMGAIANMRPDLFKGIVTAVPFVDVVTTMLDDSIPLTTGEYDEWGDPNNKAFYDYILSYSPYDNIRATDYPHMLVTTGLHDSQVQYWEPAKWVAKLRQMKKDKHRLLLHTEMEAGHSGQSGRFQQYHETALEYAFLIDLAH